MHELTPLIAHLETFAAVLRTAANGRNRTVRSGQRWPSAFGQQRTVYYMNNTSFVQLDQL